MRSKFLSAGAQLITKAHFRRVPKDRTSTFGVIFLHSHSEVAKRPSISLELFSAVRSAMMFLEAVDHVVDVFSVICWCRKVGGERRTDRIFEQSLNNIVFALSVEPRSYSDLENYAEVRRNDQARTMLEVVAEASMALSTTTKEH